MRSNSRKSLGSPESEESKTKNYKLVFDSSDSGLPRIPDLQETRGLPSAPMGTAGVSRRRPPGVGPASRPADVRRPSDTKKSEVRSQRFVATFHDFVAPRVPVQC